MPSYCTRVDFEKAFGQEEATRLADRDSVGDETIDAIEVQLARASSDVDLHLRAAGYAVPVAMPTEQLRGWVLDIGRFYLFDNGELDDSSAKVRRYKAAMGTLQMIASKKLPLDIPLSETPLPVDADMATFTTSPRAFSRETMGGN